MEGAVGPLKMMLRAPGARAKHRARDARVSFVVGISEHLKLDIRVSFFCPLPEHGCVSSMNTSCGFCFLGDSDKKERCSTLSLAHKIREESQDYSPKTPLWGNFSQPWWKTAQWTPRLHNPDPAPSPG